METISIGRGRYERRAEAKRAVRLAAGAGYEEALRRRLRTVSEQIMVAGLDRRRFLYAGLMCRISAGEILEERRTLRGLVLGVNFLS